MEAAQGPSAQVSIDYKYHMAYALSNASRAAELCSFSFVFTEDGVVIYTWQSELRRGTQSTWLQAAKAVLNASLAWMGPEYQHTAHQVRVVGHQGIGDILLIVQARLHTCIDAQRSYIGLQTP
jgi:hypothetical protein